jgi:hypothetical protein
MPGLSSGETAELATAKRRTGELETELHAMRRAVELMARGGAPKEVEAVKVMAAEDVPVQLALPVLDVAVSGYYDWRPRPPPARDPARLAYRSHRRGAPAHPRCLRGTPSCAWAAGS